MKIKSFYILLVFLGLLTACAKTEPVEEVVVSVGDRVLTMDKLRSAIPSTISAEDSAAMAERIIYHWVSQQVLLQKAEFNLTENEMDIDAEVEAYRNSLLVERYQQKLIRQSFEPEITEEDISLYYDEMKQNFRLEENLVKALYAVIPKDNRELNSFRKMLQHYNDEDYAKIEKFLYKNAIAYDRNVDNWKVLSSIKVYFPENTIKNEDYVLRSRHLYEVTEGENVYFLLIFDARMADEIAPLEYVTEQIYAILLNKAKLEFLNKMKYELYENAVNSNLIKYYNKK